MSSDLPESEGLSPRARTLIETARRQGGPTSMERAAMTAAVLTATSGAAAGAGSAAMGVSIAKLVGAGIVATVIGASGTVAVLSLRKPATVPPPVTSQPAPRAQPLQQPEPTTPPPPIEEHRVEPTAEVPAPDRAPPPVTKGQPDPVPAALTTPGEEPQTPAIAAPVPAVPPSRTAAIDTSAEEVTALGAALEALEENRPAEALELARRTRRSVPNGVLRPELMVIEIEALCAMGRSEEAKTVEASMAAADRTGLVAEKLRRSCTQTAR